MIPYLKAKSYYIGVKGFEDIEKVLVNVKKGLSP